VPGIDGEKMSKSYGNTIEIFGDEKALRKKVMALKMDSRTPAEPKPDAELNLAIQLLKVIDANAGKEWEEKLRAGGVGYGDLKKKLFEVYWDYFANARARRAELVANLDYVNKVLADGAARARTKAAEVLKRARQASGLE
jgi:tryptophanyl-tRNA synthetase